MTRKAGKIDSVQSPLQHRVVKVAGKFGFRIENEKLKETIEAVDASSLCSR